MTAQEQSGFLSGLTKDDRAGLLALGQQRRYHAGVTLFMEGDRSDFVVLLREGRVKVVRSTSEGREPLMAVRGPGDLVGELAAIDGDLEPRVATIVAIEPVFAQVIPASEFLEFVAARPRVSLALLRSLTGRLRAADRRRIEFGGYDAARRVANLLVEMADEHGVVEADGIRIAVPLSQDELAGMIGASRESVARALSRLRSKGLVHTGRRAITIVDIAILRKYGI